MKYLSMSGVLVLGRPVHQIVQALAADGFDVAQGTLCGGLKQVAPLIAPWAEAIAAHGRTAGHVHPDETSWQVFEEDIADKDGHRCWLWVFGSPYLTGVPPIRPLRPARPDPAGRPYGALAAARLLVTFRDRLRRGSFLACRAARVVGCSLSSPADAVPARTLYPLPFACLRQMRRPVLTGSPISARSGPGN